MQHATIGPSKRGNGAINALQKEDLPIHGWYRFVLSYPPHLVRQYLSAFGVARNDLLLDPFCGTGTTLVEAKKQGAVLGYGQFLTVAMNFLIVAAVLFLVIKGMNNLKRKEEAPSAPAEPPADVKLLTEIRDLLATKR